MGRAENRKRDKLLKGKLSPEQFEVLKNQTIDEQVNKEVERFIGNFVSVFLPAMKENRISDERANRIIEELYNKANQKYHIGDLGEPKPNDAYVTEDRFAEITIRVLNENNVNGAGIVAKQLYSEIMLGGEKA